MIDRVKSWVLKFALKKYALGWVVAAYDKTEGYKTQISISLMGVVTGLYTLGHIDEPTWTTLMTALSSLGGVAFAEKMKRHKKLLDGVREVRPNAG